ncbi:hypothetical protein F2P56_003408 [Juglans regia]|uniref:Cytochrome P450 71A1-like n=2 Tax=Juglans regia TaxID=51240 RepID=A0A834D490_JUGRE|nr:cytochrome P450 71A1-like [Juglans regia]KAF5476695.1 hypothetical protein F2P56_003408 [Juglans regia]
MAQLQWLQRMWQELYELPMNSLFSLLFCLFSILFIFKLLRRGKPKYHLPPSPPKLPIIGNLHQFGSLPHRSLRALSKKYGPVMLLELGHVNTLVVSSVDMARQLMKAQDIDFANRPQNTAAKILLYGCTDIGFAHYGEYWRQAKKICVLELLSIKRVQSFQHIREEEIAVLGDKIRKACVTQTPVNLSEMLIEVSDNIISRSTLGQKIEEEDGKMTFGQLSRQVMVQLMKFCLGDFFPYLAWVDVLTGFISSVKGTFKELDTFFDQVIEDHKTIMESGVVAQSNKKDFVDILLHLQRDGMLDFAFTKDNLKAILLDMFLGGADTTSTALEWIMAELIKNPKIMKKAQDEIRGIVGKKSQMDLDDISKMDYLKCVINESLRLHPPTTLLTPRETAKTVKFAGYDIPPKTTVFVNTWAIHRDPAVWENPEEFIPERFINSPFDFRGQDFEFHPFGGGRRKCPGLAFAAASLDYLIANLLCWFDWRLPGDNVKPEDLDMDEIYGLTVPKKHHLYAIPTLYSA